MEQDLQIVFNQDRAIYEEVGLAAIVKPGTKDYQVYEVLQSLGEATAREVAEELDGHVPNTRRTLNSLCTKGLVHKKNGRPDTYLPIWNEEEI